MLFGKAHLSAIAVTFAAPLLMAAVTRLTGDPRIAAATRWLLVSLLVTERIAWLALLQRDGLMSVEAALPMHLCNWAEITVALTLIHPTQITYELAYFWGLGGSVQALLTPDLSYGFPDLRFLSFFASHGGVIASVLYLTFGMDMRPVPLSMVRALGWSALYLAAAMMVNSWLGSNFGYLRRKPDHPSVMDYMPDWPYYILELSLLAVLSTFIYYSPFWLVDQLRRQ